MASIRKRGSKWQVQIRRNGLPAINRTFIAKDDAIRWAREQDRAVDRGEAFPSAIGEVRQTCLSKVLTRYVQEISPHKRGSMDRYQIRPLVQALGQISLFNLKPTHLTSYRHRRLKEVSCSTVAKEMGLLCHALKVAADEWGYAIRVEPFRAVRKPSQRSGRTRRLEAGEYERLVEALSACRKPLIRSVFEFAIATAMRRSEVLSLTWPNIDLKNRVAFLPLTKNGEARRVPLSPQAMKVLKERLKATQWTPEGLAEASSSKIFPISANAVRLTWERVRQKAGIKDLRFHDLRHEAISRFFEIGLSAPEAALISGHKDIRMLHRYVQLRPENVAKKLQEPNDI